MSSPSSPNFLDTINSLLKEIPGVKNIAFTQLGLAANVVYKRILNNPSEYDLGIHESDVVNILEKYDSSNGFYEPKTGNTIDQIASETNYSVDQIVAVLYELYYAAKDGDSNCLATLNKTATREPDYSKWITLIIIILALVLAINIVQVFKK